MTQSIVIEATRKTLVGRFGDSSYYECTGPDGARFEGQKSKATLISLLRRRYGKVTLVVKDERIDLRAEEAAEWKWLDEDMARNPQAYG